MFPYIYLFTRLIGSLIENIEWQPVNPLIRDVYSVFVSLATHLLRSAV
jgi:hypothetical protein